MFTNNYQRVTIKLTNNTGGYKMVILQESRKRTYLTPEDFETASANGIPYHTAHARVYRYDWDAERAITTPQKERAPRGTGPWSRWKDKSIVCRETFLWRIGKGWTEEEAALTKTLTRQEISERSRKYHEEKRMNVGK